jgi:hypothetical protein
VANHALDRARCSAPVTSDVKDFSNYPQGRAIDSFVTSITTMGGRDNRQQRIERIDKYIKEIHGSLFFSYSQCYWVMICGKMSGGSYPTVELGAVSSPLAHTGEIGNTNEF